MAKRLGLVAGFSLAALLSAAAPAVASTQAPAGPAAGTSGAATVHVTRAESPRRPQLGPPLPVLNVYAKTGETPASLCMQVKGDAINENWSVNGCRNVDESLFNSSQVAVRIYFSPNHGGAWTCLPMGWIGNVTSSKDVFNSGSGPSLGQPVENNVASSQVAASNDCTNAIGNPPK